MRALLKVQVTAITTATTCSTLAMRPRLLNYPSFPEAPKLGLAAPKVDDWRRTLVVSGRCQEGAGGNHLP
jgi:hypothetical protein